MQVTLVCFFFILHGTLKYEKVSPCWFVAASCRGLALTAQDVKAELEWCACKSQFLKTVLGSFSFFPTEFFGPLPIIVLTLIVKLI